MSNYIVSNILHFIAFLSDGIFIGLKFTVPIVLLLKVLNVDFKKPDLTNLIISLNLLLLSGAVLFLIILILNTGLTLYSGNEDDRSFIFSLITGPHWFQFSIPVLIYGLLPNILWMKKFQYSIYSSGVIILIWFVSYFLVDFLTHNNTFSKNLLSIDNLFLDSEYSRKFLVFIALTFIIYSIIIKRRKEIKPLSNKL